jgi:tellurite resistance protein
MSQAPASDGASAALERLLGVLCGDALFVLSSGGREPKDDLDSLLQRRSHAYAAAVQGRPHTRLTGQYEAWVVDMARAMAPVSPPAWLPMMDVVREKVTLEIGARGLRSLFSSKPSDKEVARVRRYGTLAVRVLRAVLSADGAIDREEQTIIAALISALGLPDSDANSLSAESPIAPETLDVYGEMDHAVALAVVRGAWLAAALDAVDPREEQAISVVARKLSVSRDDLEEARREALARVDGRRRTGLAAIDGIRYVLRDRHPGLGVQLAASVGTLMVPRRWRGEALAPVAQGAPLALAKRHHGLDTNARFAVLAIAWVCALVDNPTLGRLGLMRARWERLAQDLAEDDPSARIVLERWIDEALVGVARTLE